MRRWCALVLAGVLSTMALRPAAAQRDVIRSPTHADAFDRSPASASGAMRFEADRFTVVAYPKDEKFAQSLLAAARKNDTFPGLPRPESRVLIAVAPDAARFREWAGPSAPSWGAAVAFPALQRVILQGSSAAGGGGDPIVTLRHELAHLALFEALGDLPPRWFDEGYASVAAGEWGRQEALATSTGLALRGVPTLESLELMFYRGAGDAQMAYALAHRAVEDLMLRDAQRGLAPFFRSWKASQSFEIAVRDAFGLTSAGFEKQWQKDTRRRYGALALLANLSLAFGVFALILGPLIYQRRKRDRARLEALKRTEAAQEQAQRESLLAALLQGAEPADVRTAPDSVDSESRPV